MNLINSSHFRICQADSDQCKNQTFTSSGACRNLLLNPAAKGLAVKMVEDAEKNVMTKIIDANNS